MSRKIASITTTIAVVCSVLMSLAITAPGASADAPLSPHTLTSGDGTLRDQIEPLAGSQSELIYALVQTYTAPYGETFAPEVQELFARDADGTTHDLGAVPYPVGLWSTLGDVVTAGGPLAGASPTVYVWSISTGIRTQITLPAGSRYLSAGPQGAFYTDGTDLTLALSAGGTVDYGAQYTAGGEADLIPGTDGAVASERAVPDTGAGSVSYLPYATPGTVRPLVGGANTPYTYCTAIDSEGVGCRGGSGAAFLPLSGGPATDIESCLGCTNAVAGTTALWLGQGSLHSLSPGGSEILSTGDIDTLLSAYGEAITANVVAGSPYGPVLHTIAYTATSADHLTRLFTSPLSPESAGPVALHRHRLTYVADPPNAADPKTFTSVLSRALTETGSGVSASHPFTVATDLYPSVPLALASSGNSTIYTRLGTGRDLDVTLLTPRGSTTFHNALHDGSFERSQVALSKKWAMWTTRYGPVTVLNRTTNKRTIVADNAHAPTRAFLVSAALSGHYLAYNTKHGDVLRRNLNTGKIVTVYTPPSPLHIRHATVAAYSGWVGWHLTQPRWRGPVPFDGMRNVSKNSEAVLLPDQFYGLSDEGALLRSPGNTGYPTTTELQPYTGKLKPLLPTQTFNELPQIAGHAIAWVTGSGQLELAHFPA